MTQGRQRLDKWLYFTRLVKSRTLAQKIVLAGQVRLNGQKMLAPDRQVATGDVLTVTLPGRLVVVRVREPGTRRGPAPEACRLYEEVAPPHPLRSSRPEEPPANRFLHLRD
jgi:ribosome-associated heat shock protein Hsp15